MARLTEEMVVARAKQSDLSAVKKLNCWGSELVDVSLLRRMPNVEVLSLSVNKISSLSDFAHCAQLKELYVRKNCISDLSELRHLQGLQRLKSLWLDENPCATGDNYRYTVLRALPRLEKLDNFTVQPEEVQDAMKKGIPIVDPEDSDGYYDQENYAQYRDTRSIDSSPERVGDADQGYGRCDQVSDCSDQDNLQYAQQEVPTVRVDSNHQSTNLDRRRSYSHDQDDQRYEQPRPHSQYCDTSLPLDKLSAEGPLTTTVTTTTSSLRHSQSTHSIKASLKEYSPPSARSAGAGSVANQGHYSSTNPQYQSSNNRLSSEVTSPTYQGEYYERYQQEPPRCPTEAWERDKRIDRDNGPVETTAGPNIASALLADYRGFTRRPVTRNSNLLSAVLCLVKELDYPSLEVTEMAVRVRMDELANSQ